MNAPYPTIANDLRLSPAARLVLRHLKVKGSITRTEYDRNYGFVDLPARIHELRRAGYQLITDNRKDMHGHRYARYFLDA